MHSVWKMHIWLVLCFYAKHYTGFCEKPVISINTEININTIYANAKKCHISVMKN